jgi:hypothetical protein
MHKVKFIVDLKFDQTKVLPKLRIGMDSKPFLVIRLSDRDAGDHLLGTNGLRERLGQYEFAEIERVGAFRGTVGLDLGLVKSLKPNLANSRRVSVEPRTCPNLPTRASTLFI